MLLRKLHQPPSATKNPATSCGRVKIIAHSSGSKLNSSSAYPVLNRFFDIFPSPVFPFSFSNLKYEIVYSPG
jgi:hypothetical protein